MEDVVDLAVLLRAALPDVGAGGDVGREAVDVELAQVELAVTGQHQLGDGSADAPACVTQTASASHKPRTPATSPTRDWASGVKENRP